MPVVVLENTVDAVPAAKALLAGGVDVMEITFRTGGVKQDKLTELMETAYIHAVDGSWFCTKAGITAHSLKKRTRKVHERRTVKFIILQRALILKHSSAAQSAV